MRTRFPNKAFNAMKQTYPILNVLFACSILFYWIFTASIFNPVAFTLLLGLAAHHFLAKEGRKLIFPFIFLILNLFMVLALISEARESDSLFEAKELVLIGGIYLGFNITISALSIFNWKGWEVLKTTAN